MGGFFSNSGAQSCEYKRRSGKEKEKPAESLRNSFLILRSPGVVVVLGVVGGVSVGVETAFGVGGGVEDPSSSSSCLLDEGLASCIG